MPGLPRLTKPHSVCGLPLVFLPTGHAAVAADGPGRCRADSPPHRVALLELSVHPPKGCSCCPPADAWWRGLARNGFDTPRVVALALHVDSWNDLGWNDPFSSPQLSRRPRAPAARNRAWSVYTPGTFLNGREWRGWHGDELPARLAALVGERPAATIDLDASASGDALKRRGQVRWERGRPGAQRATVRRK